MSETARRRHPRVRLTFLVQFRFKDFETFAREWAENLSVGGVFVRTAEPYEVGTLVVVSFTLDGIHPHDLAELCNREAVAIRAGHHCAQPLMDFYHVPATARASLAFYNTFGEIDTLIAALYKVIEVFK